MAINEQEIQICFPLCDRSGRYSKYVGVMLTSVLENTKSRVCLHMLHDASLTEENKNKFRELAARYGQRIFFYEVTVPDGLFKGQDTQSGKVGTYFRLWAPKLLPEAVKKVIYLDADLLVALDVADLWQMPMDGKLVLARKDVTERFLTSARFLFEDGVLREDDYMNAGVMVLDVKTIRQRWDLVKEAASFFSKYPECYFADQDVLNYLLAGQKKFIDEKYNSFTVMYRDGRVNCAQRIWHFAGDIPFMCPRESFDAYFFELLLKSGWGDSETLYEDLSFIIGKKYEAFNDMLHILKSIRTRKVIVWGAASVLTQRICSLLPLNEDDYCVDNNKNLWGKKINGLRIYSPTEIKKETKGKVIVLVISKIYYKEIKEQLESYGLTEHEEFFDAQIFLTEYKFR